MQALIDYLCAELLIKFNLNGCQIKCRGFNQKILWIFYQKGPRVRLGFLTEIAAVGSIAGRGDNVSAFLVCLIIAFQIIGVQAQAVGSRPSPTIGDEYEMLEQISLQFETLREQIAAADDALVSLRKLANSGSATAKDSRAAKALMRSSRLQWSAIERTYDEARLSGLYLRRPSVIKNLDLAPDLMAYLAFKHHVRFGTGTPLSFLLMSWRGLGVGDKFFTLPPDQIRTEIKIAGVQIDSTDGLLFMTINGGVIRGRLAGIDGENIILREVLSPPLTRLQVTGGMFRRFTLEKIARMEVIRLPERYTPQPVPQPAIDSRGSYSDYYAKNVVRIDLQPDDLTLVDWVDEGRKTGYQYRPKVNVVTAKSAVRPDYVGVYFADCAALLRR